jgi:glycosyltransferase involved in cell wall biosynthesis
MRVLIDATPLLVRSAGVKNYLYHWIDHLRRAAGADTIRTLPAIAESSGLRHDSSVAGRLRTVRGLGMLALANYTALPVIDLAARQADIFHASVLVRRPPRSARLTATVHDLTAFLMPELHSAANRRAEESFAGIMRRADGLIAVSESTRQDAVRVLGIAPERITVIHSGVADNFFDCPAAVVDAVRRRYGLGRGFVLFVGTIEPRKNLDVLLDAYEALPVGLREHYEMVVAGPEGWHAGRTMERLQHVRYLGYVPEEDLAPLTAAATVFAYPSLYEGFGFPVAQAMAAGVPVITSNVSAMPEVAGNAAILVDPRSQSELRSALSRVLTSPELRISMAASGRERAKQFRWTECAGRSLKFFERIADR